MQVVVDSCATCHFVQMSSETHAVFCRLIPSNQTLNYVIKHNEIDPRCPLRKGPWEFKLKEN